MMWSREWCSVPCSVRKGCLAKTQLERAAEQNENVSESFREFPPTRITEEKYKMTKGRIIDRGKNLLMSEYLVG